MHVDQFHERVESLSCLLLEINIFLGYLKNFVSIEIKMCAIKRKY